MRWGIPVESVPLLLLVFEANARNVIHCLGFASSTPLAGVIFNVWDYSAEFDVFQTNLLQDDWHRLNKAVAWPSITDVELHAPRRAVAAHGPS